MRRVIRSSFSGDVRGENMRAGDQQRPAWKARDGGPAFLWQYMSARAREAMYVAALLQADESAARKRDPITSQ